MLAARLPEYDDWFYRYCGDLATPEGAERDHRYLRDMLRLARFDPEGKTVIDVGCGFGFTLLTLADWGARCALGIDSYKPMIDTVKAYLRLIDPAVAERISVEVGDAAVLPYPDETADLVISKEAISHYRDVQGFLREAHRVLCFGGRMVIVDGNNGANPRIVRETRRIWRAFERGDVGEVEGHDPGIPYRQRRLEIVRAHAPDLDAECVADRTFGMTKAEVERACDAVRSGGFVERPYDAAAVPLDPDTGAVIERLFDPFQLGREIAEMGFRVTVRGYWGGAQGKRHVRAANRFLSLGSRLTMSTARAFMIAAWKR